ncbi:putative cuticle collagen 99 [Vidua macroura]|uniref:putative cuticle collagen 99 n=1 Tax=Vidua macroura TaxID=187451 RepID=UPI0023A80B52|nr:putative cuticle collagen 99 [Vidua macroura]
MSQQSAGALCRSRCASCARGGRGGRTGGAPGSPYRDTGWPLPSDQAARPRCAPEPLLAHRDGKPLPGQPSPPPPPRTPGLGSEEPLPGTRRERRGSDSWNEDNRSRSRSPEAGKAPGDRGYGGSLRTMPWHTKTQSSWSGDLATSPQ